MWELFVVQPCPVRPRRADAATIRVAVVSNPNMINIEKLTPEFEKLNPGIKVVYDTLTRTMSVR